MGIREEIKEELESSFGPSNWQVTEADNHGLAMDYEGYIGDYKVEVYISFYYSEYHFTFGRVGSFDDFVDGCDFSVSFKDFNIEEIIDKLKQVVDGYDFEAWE